MSSAKRSTFEIREEDLSEMVTAMEAARATNGWLNCTPGVPDDYPQFRPSLFAWLVGPTPPGAPIVTWMPGHNGQPDTLGILHAKGKIGLHQGANIASIPSSWRCRQDHNRRGLLFEVPAVTDAELATVIVSSCDELATVPTTGNYLVELFTRS
jgi:hypothetical protein